MLMGLSLVTYTYCSLRQSPMCRGLQHLETPPTPSFGRRTASGVRDPTIPAMGMKSTRLAEADSTDQAELVRQADYTWPITTDMQLQHV